MNTWKNRFQNLNQWILRNFLLICLLGGGAFYLFGSSQDYFPEPMRGSMEYSAGMIAPNDNPTLVAASSDSYNYKMANRMADMAMPPVFAEGYDPNVTDKKIIRNASLTLEVEDTEEASKLVKDEVAHQKGDITNLNSWQVRPGVLGYNLTIRVPAESLDGFRESLEKIGTKTNESVSTSDITAQYRDNEVRLKNLRAREERLVEILARKTEDLGQVLQIDQAISENRNQIEMLEASQKRNDIDVAYSTLQLSLQPETQIGDLENPEWSVKKSWRNSVNALFHQAQEIADKLLLVLAFTPLWLPVVLILCGIKRRFLK